MEIFNRSSDKKKRQSLRNNMPDAEKILWSRLKGKQVYDYKFRRQYGVERYVVDFFCANLRLAIEIDGDSHFINEKDKYDIERQKFIEKQGIRFLRFSNKDVYTNLEGVIKTIEAFINEERS